MEQMQINQLNKPRIGVIAWIFIVIKWMILIVCALGSFGLCFATWLLNSIQFQTSQQIDSRYVLDEWTYEHTSDDLNFNVDVYQNENKRYALIENNPIEIIEQNRFLFEQYFNTRIQQNYQTFDYINGILIENSGVGFNTQIFDIKYQFDALKLFDEEPYVINVVANENNLFVETSNISLYFYGFVNVVKKDLVDLNILNYQLFDLTFYFKTETPSLVSMTDIKNYVNYEYPNAGNSPFVVLKEKIVTQINLATGIIVTPDEINFSINTDGIRNFDFSYKHLVSATVSPNNNILTNKVINSATILFYAQAIFALPDLGFLTYEPEQISFLTLDNKAISVQEYQSIIANNSKIKNSVLALIQNELRPNFTSSDFTIQVRSLTGGDYVENYNLSNVKRYRYRVNPTTTGAAKVGGSFDFYCDFIGIQPLIEVVTNFNYGMSWSGKLWHEGYDTFVGVFPSYGSWDIGLEGLDLIFRYNEMKLYLLDYEVEYTPFQLRDLGICDNTDGSTVPYFQAYGNSYIALGQNDYLNNDFSMFTWFGAPGPTVTLAERDKIYLGEDLENKNWIVDGSRSHDFHLRLENLWNTFKIKKVFNTANKKDELQVFKTDQTVRWTFAQNSRWGTKYYHYGFTTSCPQGSWPFKSAKCELNYLY